ncbi:MAG: hypothetical protein CM15mV126_170 [uncultured marine virus]|nr:MAG: hypothetical protein CM15mV126_170 [uncultured marine virus]
MLKLLEHLMLRLTIKYGILKVHRLGRLLISLVTMVVFSTVATDDVFGYTTQGYVYAEGADKPFGGWIVINKSTGEWALTETPLADDEYKANALKVAKDNVVALQSNKEFERCYEDEEEYFRKQKTGNRVLNSTCGFCPYKFPCWGENLQLLPQQQSQGKNPKWVWYTEVNNPRVEDDVA